MSLTHRITPINETSNMENVYEHVYKFLKQILSNNILTDKIVSQDYVRANGGVGRMFYLATTEKDEKYVICSGGLERLIGSIYLRNALTDDTVKKFEWKTANSKVVPLSKTSRTGKFTITIKRGTGYLKNLLLIDSDGFVALSEYVGEKKAR